MSNLKINTNNNISGSGETQDFGIKNYFLEAQKRAGKLGQNIKKKMPPIFDNYLSQSSSPMFAPTTPGSVYKTCSDH